MSDSVVGTGGASCGGGGGGGGSGGVAVVAVVAGWEVLWWGVADDGMFGSLGAGGVSATVDGVGSEGTAVVEADA